MEDWGEGDIRQTVAFRGGFYNKALRKGRKDKGLSQYDLRDIVQDMIGRPMRHAISDYETLKAYPDPTEARAIADVLEVPIEVLFPARLENIRQKRAWQEISPEMLSISEQRRFLVLPKELAPEESVEKSALAGEIESVLAYLTTRQRLVLEMRFGLGKFKKVHTLGEVGDVLGVTKERVRQIEGKALMRIRNPRLTRRLHGFID